MKRYGIVLPQIVKHGAQWPTAKMIFGVNFYERHKWAERTECGDVGGTQPYAGA